MPPTDRAPDPELQAVPADRALFLPVAFAAVLVGLRALPAIGQHPVVSPTFLGAAAFILAWTALLWARAARSDEPLRLGVALRTHHWVQAAAQLVLLLYWGWFVRPVYAFLPFIFAQLMFAYAVESLLNWTRRGEHRIGLGPLPIVLSINFFLWFRPEWFYWQFVIVLLGYAAKEFIRWQRDGRTRHVFNPSSFPLSVFSLVLIATGTTDATFGLEIAQTLFNPPRIYLVIFLVALPAQILFGVATMTISAVLTTYLWGLAYFAATGTFYFRDAFIPIAVFLGMHLLFTDPATSPRTESGRILFGIGYALATIALAGLLEAVGAPTFYDKLLPIPLLNLSVRYLDRLGGAAVERVGRLQWPVMRPLQPLHRRLAVVALWVVAFAGMRATGGVGDDHPGQYLPFWRDACAEGSARACEYLAEIEATYCERGSGWACNELALTFAREARIEDAVELARRGCELRFAAACANVGRLADGAREVVHAAPGLEDLPIVLRGSKGPVPVRSAPELYALGCERGWAELCGRQTRGTGADRTPGASPPI